MKRIALIMNFLTLAATFGPAEGLQGRWSYGHGPELEQLSFNSRPESTEGMVNRPPEGYEPSLSDISSSESSSISSSSSDSDSDSDSMSSSYISEYIEDEVPYAKEDENENELHFDQTEALVSTKSESIFKPFFIDKVMYQFQEVKIKENKFDCLLSFNLSPILLGSELTNPKFCSKKLEDKFMQMIGKKREIARPEAKQIAVKLIYQEVLRSVPVKVATQVTAQEINKKETSETIVRVREISSGKYFIPKPMYRKYSRKPQYGTSSVLNQVLGGVSFA